jgi:flagellar FliJ protein
MVKRLNSLARLYKFRVEEKQKELGFVTAMIADLELQLGKLEAEIPNEHKVAKNSPQEAGALFGNYLAHYFLRKEQFNHAIAELEEKLMTIQSELQDKFKDYKSIELTINSRINSENLELQKIEQSYIDEIAIENFRRISIK